MKYFWILIIFLLISCKNEILIENDDKIIFFGTKGVYKGDTFLFSPIEYPGVHDKYYDDISKKYWLHSINENDQSVFQTVLPNGTLSEPIIITYENFKPLNGGAFYVVNNLALINRTVIINLETKEMKYTQMKIPQFSVLFGFNGEYVFGNNWYYNIIDEQLIYYPEHLKYFVYNENADIVLALSENNTIVMFDYRKNEIIDTNVIKKINEKDFNNYGSYYLKGNYLYYTKNKRRSIEQSFWYYLFGFGSQPIKWYKFDLVNKNTIPIYSPDDFAVIIGNIN
jgi:hypothetical protein